MNKNKRIVGKTVAQWIDQFPLLQPILSTKEVFWINPDYNPLIPHSRLNEQKIREAEARFERFAPYIAHVFPETATSKGILESDLIPIPRMKQHLEAHTKNKLPGEIWLKCDSHLPISGSIKSRGGIHEVLKYAETLAIENGMITPGDSYQIFASNEFKKFFAQYTIIVGSTGNLGLSIGMMSANMGFKVIVHMSADAKTWKKELLRQNGVTVVEHNADFSVALHEGKKQAEKMENSYFIDDENSENLFFGYAVAGYRLKKQLDDRGIIVDNDHPLFVYLPCGVGGSPGGVTYGLKSIYHEYVHCFFAEPTHSPAMLLGLLTGLRDQIHVHDFGIDNQTEADGLAVGRPSKWVSNLIPPYLSGIYTIEDKRLFLLLKALMDTEQISLEPSALAGMWGPMQLAHTQVGKQYLRQHELDTNINQSHHIIWATGGSLVPEEERKAYYNRGLLIEMEKKRSSFTEPILL